MTVLIATIAVLTFDIYVYLTNPDMSKISIMMMGVLAANIVWFLGDIMMNRSDNKIERWNKKNLNELMNQKEYIDAVNCMNGAKKQYEETIKYYTDPTYASIVSRENTQPVSESPEVEK
jgi:ABC-type bacteriocin/lantibiotic exporter with double-glycine peptidase domain